MKLITEFIMSSNFGSMMGIFLTVTLTYTFTKWADRKKKYLDVYSFQLKKIFAPMYLIVYDKNVNSIDKTNFYNNLTTKRKKYFLYLPDDFLRIINKMENEFLEGKISNRTLKLSKEYIEYQYSKLRRTLGYTEQKINPLKANFYGIYSTAKVVLCIILSMQASLMSILMIAFEELFEFYPNVYYFLELLLAALVVMSCMCAVLYCFFIICWYIKTKY